MKKILIVLLVLAMTLTALTACSPKVEEPTFPTKPIQFIVPWSPGGGSDVAMRIVAQHAEKYLGQPVTVVNIPGVSGTIGLMELTEKPADGYYIGLIHEGLVVAHHAGVTEINYDSFIPIANMTDTPQWFAAYADAPYDTLEEFYAYAKANPGKVNFGMTLKGVAHAWGASMAEQLGTEFNLIPYEGTGERMKALAGGFIDVTVSDYASVVQFVENGDLKLLASCGEERSVETPELPTLVESGYDLVFSVRRGIVVPLDTPDDIVAILGKALADTAKDPEFIEDLMNMQIETLYLDQTKYIEYMSTLDENTAKIASQLQ